MQYLICMGRIVCMGVGAGSVGRECERVRERGGRAVVVGKGGRL